MSKKTVFISYRRDATGKHFARSIKQALGHDGYDVFLDVDCVDSGKWATQILTEVPKRAHFLLLLTPGALDRCNQEDDWVRKEFLAAVAHERNIVPVREDSVELSELRRGCPESVSALLDYQIATIQHTAFTRDIATLIERFIPPHKAPDTPATPSPSIAGFQADISRIIKYAPADLIGRESELSVLSTAWDKVRRAETPRPHVITFVALGGEGKTSLVAKWSAELAHAGWPGCEAAFAWSFYSQGTREQVAASSDLFLKEALTFFGDEALANSAQGAYDKGRRLAQLVGQRRALLILDGLEPLQYAPTSPTPGELKDQGIAALLKGLAASNHGLCVVTTRYSIADLRTYRQTTAPEIELWRLSTEAGVALLKKLGVKTGSREDFERLVEDVDGHALTLQIVGGFLARAFQGDIRRRDRVKFEKADAKIQGGHAFRAMAAYVKWLENESEEARREVAILQLLGLFDRPATGDCIAALVAPPAIPGLTEPLVALAEEDWEFSLTALEAAKLITVNRATSGTLLSLDAHPLLREYFALQLRSHRRQTVGAGSQDGPPSGDGGYESDATSDAWRAAHRRLYDHLCATTKEGDQPTLEDLQPLYQAVAHGCHAGLQQEACEKVYRDRIYRRHENYAASKFGAFGSEMGAVACFFESPWSRVSQSLSDAAQGWFLAVAAFGLRALGRLIEALEPMRAGIPIKVKRQDWTNAAVNASNLSELELTLGDVAGAVGDAEQSVTYADRSGDAFQRMARRTTHADALHQAGRRAEAEARFREAEKLRAESQPEYPLLYSLPGFRYCDLLLAAAEREAWQTMLANGGREPTGVSHVPATQRGEPVGSRPPFALTFMETCRAVSQRATQTLKESEAYARTPLLDIALDHLTLGRAALYAAILEQSKIENQKSQIDQAVSGLRRAGQQDELPKALLTRAWLRFLTGTRTGPESAQSDLDEAWEIAQRGPMPLFMADVCLYRARLFGRPAVGESGSVGRPATAPGPGTAPGPATTEYPWESPEQDLAEARRLIVKCGYLRRMEELEDAEAALNRS